MKFVIFLAIFLLLYFIVHRFFSKFKFPKIGALGVFTGAVKVGKSAVSLACAHSCYKRIHRQWKFRVFFTKLFNKLRKHKVELPEEPLFYSNIPLAGIPYVELTTEHLLRKYRLNFKSVVFVDEASLLADSQLIKDGTINNQLLLFFKLYGHSTHGGKAIFNSQCLTDLHYALRRCTNQYFYIHHISKYIPFFCLASLREERFSEDGSTVNNYNDDVENSLKRVFIRKSIFKKYDSFAFSIFTDNLPTKNKVILKSKFDSLKIDKIVSFRQEFANLKAFLPESDKEVKK